jgi:hypothetical protein
MYVSYDPMLLQLVGYDQSTEDQSYPVETGVVVPEIANGMQPPRRGKSTCRATGQGHGLRPQLSQLLLMRA